MTEDSELLRQYAEDHSEAAFTELVKRRIDLVFSVALRQGGGDVQLAEEVTQQTFVALARKARSLARHPSLGGWLYRAAQFAATDAVRAQCRRRGREQETNDMPESFASTDGSPAWEQLRPMLDLALSELSPADRDAVSLRFFEGRPFADIGRVLRLNEDAARKRVDRALDRLHAGLSRVGVTSSTAALAVALTGQVNAAAPAVLVTNVTLAAISGTTLAGGGFIAPILFQLMNTTKITLGVVSVLAALGIGAAFLEHRRAHSFQEALTESRRQNNLLQTGLQHAERASAAANADASALLQATDKLSQSFSPKPKVFFKNSDLLARSQHARALAKSGDWEGALNEYLWLFDVGMRQSSGFGAVRLTMVNEIAKLGQSYPPALVALEQRRDQTSADLQAGDEDFGDIMEFTSLNKALGDGSRNLAFYDQLPPNDSQRRSLSKRLYDEFVAGQRYTEAAQARPYSAMVSEFQTMTRWPNNPNSDGAHSDRAFMLTTISNDVEVLAGVNKITEARQLAASLLAFDGSDATRSALQARATRAGHPDLLATLPSR